MITQLNTMEINGSNLVFTNTRRGPLMHFKDNNGLVCLLAAAETKTAAYIRDMHISFFKEHYDKEDPKDSFQTVLEAQEDWRDNQEWKEINGILFMNGTPAYRLLDHTVKVTKEWFSITATKAERLRTLKSLSNLKTEFNEFINSLKVTGSISLQEWHSDQVTEIISLINEKISNTKS